jgi:hypothetical protein
MIIGEVGNHVDDELVLVESGLGAPQARPDRRCTLVVE